MSRRTAVGLASALTVTLGVGVAIAADHGGGKPDQSAAVAPLSAEDHAALTIDKTLIEGLSQTLAEVPQAAADAAGSDVASAQGELARLAALRPLIDAVEGRSAAVTVLVTSYRALLAHGVPTDDAELPQALETLQAIEGDVVPAVRVIALKHGHQLSSADALTAVERDRRTAALGQLLANWSEVYGVFVLVEQAASSSG